MKLTDMVAERRKRQLSTLEAKQVEVQREAAHYSVLIQASEAKIRGTKTELENRTSSFKELLEKERRDRNELEDKKEARGKEIGQRFFESLVDIQSQADEKANRLLNQLQEEHGELEREYHTFESNYKRMMGNTPNRYLKESGERMEEFRERQQGVEEKVSTLEGDIQRNFRKIAEQRIETVDSLESAISSAKQSLSQQRSQLSSDIEARYQRLNSLLAGAASRLGLVAPAE